MILWLDLETYSEKSITCGAYAYAECAEILLFAYAIDDGPVNVWDVTSGEPCHEELKSALKSPEIKIVAHNSHFDRTILRTSLPLIVDRGVERWHDTMIQAISHSLPGSLGALCEIYKLDTDKAKDKKGRTLINLFCKPRPKNSKIRRATRETHPVEWQEFIEYAALDIVSMREIYKKLPRWNLTETERRLWELDQLINDRGVLVDTALAVSAIHAIDAEQVLLAERSQALTDSEVSSATRRDLILRHIVNAYGVTLPDLQKPR